MEQDGQEATGGAGSTGVGGGVSRSQNTVYVMPHDWASIAQFLAPQLQRVDESSAELQLLVITSDAELAAAVGAAAVKLTAGRNVNVVAATSAKRAERLLRLRPAQVVAGTAETLVALLHAAAMKLDTVRLACLAWTDEIVARGALPALETLMPELPKDSARTMVTSELTPAVEELLERYARRARRVVAPTTDVGHPVNVDYVTVATPVRLATLRRLLDQLDPASATVFVRDEESGTPVRDLLRALGYTGSDAAVTVSAAAPPGTALAILFDLPASREELREAAGAATRAVALVQPRQIASLRALAAGGNVAPITLGESGGKARDRDAKVRAELREMLVAGQFGRELLALEPLLEEYDGVEIAAAALQVLERERAARVTPAAGAPAVQAPRVREAGNSVRLFVNVGERDNVRPGDLVGAFANQAGIAGGEVGRIDVRESHSIVEVSPDVADAVIERVTGTEIRGRRAIVRRDEERPRRESGGGRDAGGRGRDSRPRGGDREGRPERRPRDTRDTREPRGDRGSHGPRSERRPPADRPRSAARPPRFEGGE